MPQVINTNVPSLNSQRALNKSQSALSTSLQRLSSGLRINSAKDDAAGLAISSRMSAQISGLDTARRNANDGVSLSQTAESALSSIGENLNRMRDLAVQSANATNSDADRAALNAEIVQLQAEIQRVGDQTEFNGRKLLDGSFVNQFFQIGANASQGVNVTLTDSRASGMGQQFSMESFTASAVASGDHRYLLNGVEIDVSYTADDQFVAFRNAINNAFDKTGVRAELNAAQDGVVLTGTGFTFTALTKAAGASSYTANSGAVGFSTGDVQQSVTTASSGQVNNVLAQALTVKGNNTQYIVNVAIGDSIKTIADKVNAASHQTGVSATGRTTATLLNLAEDGTVGFKLNGKNTEMPVTISAVVKTDDLSELVNAINVEADKTGITATLSNDKRAIYLVNEEGYDIKISEFTTTAATTPTIDLMGATGNGTTLTSGAATNNATVAGRLSFDSEGMFDVTSNLGDATVGGTFMADATTYSDRVSVADINVNTLQSATRAIKVLDAAINGVNSARANLGALQNRFDAAITNLQTNSENLSAARSRIRDTDFAAETSNLAMATILQQSGISILSQANQLPNNVLSLLR